MVFPVCCGRTCLASTEPRPEPFFNKFGLTCNASYKSGLIIQHHFYWSCTWVGANPCRLRCSTITCEWSVCVPTYFWPYSGRLSFSLLFTAEKPQFIVEFQVKSLQRIHLMKCLLLLTSLFSFCQIYLLILQTELGMYCCTPPHHFLFHPPWAELPLAAARITDRFPPWWALAQVRLQNLARANRPNQTPLVKKRHILSGSIGSGVDLWTVEASSFEQFQTAGQFEQLSGQLHGGPAGCTTGVGVI